jgi:hypothetical protein
VRHALFIDPGISEENGTGWAHFVENIGVAFVHSCGLVQAPRNYPLWRKCLFIMHHVNAAAAPGTGGPYDLLVIEHMRVYPIARMKGDPNDLLDLAVLEGTLLQISAADQKLVPARDWKGQVPKNVMKPRIQRSLSEAERSVVRDATQSMNAKAASNVWDALGLGLHHYGRLR